MELRHLRYFAAVAEAGNLSRAAEKLFIAQPPLSLQIRQFEEEVGATLFIRHPKGVKLTPAGQALLPEARFLLDRAARLRDIAKDAGDGSIGTLRLGFVPSASSTVLPDLIRKLRAALPRLNVELSEMISDEQSIALVNGTIDAGVARTAGRHSRVKVVCEMPDPFCIAIAKAETEAKAGSGTPEPGMPAELKNYAEHSFVAFTRHRGPAYFDQSVHLCSRAGFSPRVRYEASTVHGVLDLVGAGLGVALVPASAALLLGDREVVLRRLRRSEAGEVLTLLRRKSDNNPLLQQVDEAVDSIFANLVARVDAALESA